jgi:hypothetical protein
MFFVDIRTRLALSSLGLVYLNIGLLQPPRALPVEFSTQETAVKAVEICM